MEHEPNEKGYMNYCEAVQLVNDDGNVITCPTN